MGDNSNAGGGNTFNLQMRKQLVFFLVLVIAALAGLIARIAYININKGQEYEKKVLAQLSGYDSVVLPYKRGSILDCKGTTLATCEKVYNVKLSTKDITYFVNQKENPAFYQVTADALATCFGVNANELVTFMNNNPQNTYKLIARRVSYEDVQKFNDLCEAASENKEALKIYGVAFDEEYIRSYPNGSMASDVIGFTNDGNAGSYGLEQYYNDVLNGTDGRKFGYLNEDLNMEKTTIPAVDGNTLVTTIDANIQAIVEEKTIELNESLRDNFREGQGSRATGVIVMECDTGNILAMYDYPGFDLNADRVASSYYTEEELARIKEQLYKEALEKKEKEAAAAGLTAGVNTTENTTPEGQNPEGTGEDGETEGDTPGFTMVEQLVTDEDVNDYARAYRWANYCIQQTYEPGSVAKPFTVAAGIDSGKMTGDEVYFCGGYLEVGGFRIKCHNRNGDGQMTVSNAVAQSCNVALMKMGQQMGIDTYLDYFQRYNFGYKTNIDLAGEAKTNTLVFTKNTMGPTELATSTFGQGYQVTMIEMISAFNSLINGGYYYQPHIVSQILDSNGAVVKNIEPSILKQTISNSTSEKIRSYCNAVVTSGTGKKARPAGYTVGGKTGTAETLPRTKSEYVTSFMGYAPADDPKIIVYVVIDRPNLPDQQGGTALACTLTKDIFTEVLPYRNIFMTEELTEAEKNDLIAKGLYNEAIYRPEEHTGEPVDDGIDIIDDKPEMKIDPATGYGIDPLTGEFLDPETGYPIDPSSSDLADLERTPETTTIAEGGTTN